jgi:hypothetical protein
MTSECKSYFLFAVLDYDTVHLEIREISIIQKNKRDTFFKSHKQTLPWHNPIKSARKVSNSLVKLALHIFHLWYCQK